MKKLILVLIVFGTVTMSIFPDADTTAAVTTTGFANLLQMIKETAEVVKQVENTIQVVENTGKQLEAAYKSVKNFKPQTWQDYVDFINLNADRVEALKKNAKQIAVIKFNGKSYNIAEVMPLAVDWATRMHDIQTTYQQADAGDIVADLLKQAGFNDSVQNIFRATVDLESTIGAESLAVYSGARDIIKTHIEAFQKVVDENTDDSMKADNAKIVAGLQQQLFFLSELYDQQVAANAQRALEKQIAENNARLYYEQAQNQREKGAGYTNADDFKNIIIDGRLGPAEDQ